MIGQNGTTAIPNLQIFRVDLKDYFDYTIWIDTLEAVRR